jgi:site-specific DNA-cytosine methylase
VRNNLIFKSNEKLKIGVVSKNYIELCAGLGGMGFGLMQAGMTCVGYAECDTKCEKCNTFTQHQAHPKKSIIQSA